MATKTVEDMPSTMFANAAYVDPHKTLTKLKEKDLTKMPSGRDFNSNIKNNVLSTSPKSKKVFIQPLRGEEKSGPKWY